MSHPQHLIRALLATAALCTGFSAFAQSAPVAPQQGRHAMQRLQAADADKDGQLSRSEVDKSAPRLAKAFDKLDTDKDGKLSQTELRGMRQHMRGHHDRGMFKRADADQDGFVTRAEMDKFMADMNAQARQHFDGADANKDGKVSQEEMRSFGDKMRGNRMGAGQGPAPAR